jgi:hypothetical protein
MTRIIMVVAGLLLIFFVLAQMVPDALLLPLYCIFTLGGMGYVFWERSQIGNRRAATQLERELQHERLRGPGAKPNAWDEEE